MIRFEGVECDLLAFEVDGSKGSSYAVHVCRITGECWCQCDDFFFRQQTHGIPTVLSPNLCKHVRLILSKSSA
jgi:hypothetical protein